MIRVLIADDHVVVRNGLKQLFSVMGGVEVVGEAASGEELLVALKSLPCDLILLDLSMPGLSGVNLIARIHAAVPAIPLLILSMHDELPIAKRVLQAGAKGFVTKGSGEHTLIAAIQRVAGGGRFVDPVLAEQLMFAGPPVGEQAPHQRLSVREFHVFKLLARGYSVNDIAQELFISNKTVSTHKYRLMKKMNFRNNAELVLYAAEHALIETAA